MSGVLGPLAALFADADTTDVLSYSATGLPAGLSINPTSGLISGTLASSASAGGPYGVTITADDGNGGTTTQSFTWIVNNPTPTANDDNYSLGEDAAATVLGNAITDNDSDPDGDALSATVQTNVAGSSGERCKSSPEPATVARASCAASSAGRPAATPARANVSANRNT